MSSSQPELMPSTNVALGRPTPKASGASASTNGGVRGVSYWEIKYWTTVVKPTVVQRLWEHQQGRCAYCMHKMRLVQGQPTRRLDATIDHIVPISKGGAEYNVWNMILACYHCNNTKGDSDWTPRLPYGKKSGIFDGMEEIIGGFDRSELGR